jgi:hypothetical protein
MCIEFTKGRNFLRMFHNRRLYLLFAVLVALGIARGASAQPRMIFLGMAHVDGPTDHDDIKVGPYAGRYHSIVLRVKYAPIQFDHVVIHYGNGTAQTLPVRSLIRPGGQSAPVMLPGGDRVIESLELWYARANLNNPNKPEVRLFGMP